MNRRDFLKLAIKLGTGGAIVAVTPGLVFPEESGSGIRVKMTPYWEFPLPTRSLEDYGRTLTIDKKEIMSGMSDLNFDQVVDGAIEAIKESRSIVVKRYG